MSLSFLFPEEVGTGLTEYQNHEFPSLFYSLEKKGLYLETITYVTP
jgi:hypothetical protein